MEDDAVKASLQAAGFTKYEAEAYLALIEHGSMSAIDAAQHSGVPKSRIYDVLRNLESKDLAETYEQNTLRARALDPGSVVDDLRERSKRLDETADELEDLWSRPALDEYDVTLVTRPETVLERTRDFVRAAENEVQIAGSIDQLDALRPVLHEARGRDVVVKLSVCPITDGTEPSVEEFDFEGVATQACFRTLRAPFIALIDRSRTCFSPQSRSGQQFGIVAKNRSLTYVFQWYFLSGLWEEAQIFYSVRRTEPPITYVNIRQCVVDIAPLYHEGATISVSVEGYDNETGDLRRVGGPVVDLVYSETTADNAYPTLSEVSGQVSLFVDSGEEVYSVGGRYAQVEDIELRRLTVESIEK